MRSEYDRAVLRPPGAGILPDACRLRALTGRPWSTCQRESLSCRSTSRRFLEYRHLRRPSSSLSWACGVASCPRHRVGDSAVPADGAGGIQPSEGLGDRQLGKQVGELPALAC